MHQQRRIFWFTTALLTLTTALSLFAAELGLRILIYGDSRIGSFLRYPGLYADSYSDDDYQKLLYWWWKAGRPADRPDNLLGWVKRDITPGSHIHAKESALGSRQPVLLYGDSWAECLAPADDCFNAILEKDRRFRERFHLINFGVGGYGVDQAFLLYKATVPRFTDPLIVFSFLDEDMDRAVLHVLKPFFVQGQSGLDVQGTPVSPDAKGYFESHPPQIWSYLYRMAIYSDRSPLPEAAKAYLRGDLAKIKKKEEISRAILLAAHEDMEKRRLRHVFLVFEETFKVWKSDDQLVSGGIRPTASWHRPFLEKFFAEHAIPHIWASKVIEQHTNKDSYDWTKFVVSARDSHPNGSYNRLIAERLIEWSLTGK